MTVRYFYFLLFVSFISIPVLAEPLYVIEGARGSVTFTTRKPRAGEQYKIMGKQQPQHSMLLRSHKDWRHVRAVSSKYDSLIAQEADLHNVETALVKAVVHIESAFKPHATSKKGAMGLMQLMPATASRFGVADAYKPEENVRGGIQYLKFLLDRYRGNIRLALAAYNAGEEAVDRYRGIPPYNETRNYVQLVLRARELYLLNEPTTG